ncbi:protein FAM83G isoform X1 [Piliocolobus tephrosceles]|uniref:protein FAM83G isoform X1 n=1 Tax=Piliocolobus tephrosceles TaxID=591936 RepID=UPI000E6AF881|nr:protein FAM83G isoform X1 [Piliocolobus tephrosceles]
MLRGGQCVASPGLGMLTNTGPLVIAVVRDMSTDVDIFKDLLDTGFKRKAAVYIIMDESKVKYILHMFEWTHMRLGHLKVSRLLTCLCGWMAGVIQSVKLCEYPPALGELLCQALKESSNLVASA